MTDGEMMGNKLLSIRKKFINELVFWKNQISLSGSNDGLIDHCEIKRGSCSVILADGFSNQMFLEALREIIKCCAIG
jgi:hypothetical protein